MDDKKLLFIVNPRAGKTKSLAPLFDAAAIYSEAGYLVSVRKTTHRGEATEPVSYTHLDVYKRQAKGSSPRCDFLPPKNTHTTQQEALASPGGGFLFPFPLFRTSAKEAAALVPRGEQRLALHG